MFSWKFVAVRKRLAALVLIVAVCGCGQPEAHGSTPNQGRHSSTNTTDAAESAALAETRQLLSAAERSILSAYQASLKSAVVREASLEHLLRQLAHNPPVAFVDGYWATPVDLAALLQSSPIHDALRASLAESPAGEEASLLLADTSRLKQLAAIAFTAKPLREQAGLPYELELGRMAEVEPQAIGLFLVPVKDVDWSLAEYLPPLPEPGGAAECYFFCGDAETWDFDGDGTPDVRDEDDDNDGTADDRDDYPYWPAATSCECDIEVIVVLVTKFAVSIKNSVVAALTTLAGLHETSTSVPMGSLGAEDIPVQLVLASALVPLEERPGAHDCPAEGAPGVSYISTDPNDCATIRFRCSAGQVAFTNHCGCGCVDQAVP